MQVLYNSVWRQEKLRIFWITYIYSMAYLILLNKYIKYAMDSEGIFPCYPGVCYDTQQKNTYQLTKVNAGLLIVILVKKLSKPLHGSV